MINGINACCIALAGLIIFVTGCRKDNDIPSVTHLDGSFELLRADRILADAAELDDTVIAQLMGAHPAFWQLYLEVLMPAAQEFDDGVAQLQAISADVRAQEVLQTIDTTYSDLSVSIEGLEAAFQYYQYYFPERLPPQVYTLYTDFGYFPFIFAADEETDGLGISLELFLGENFAYTRYAGSDPAFSQYLTRTYNKDHLVKKAVDVLVSDILGPAPGQTLLDQMVHNGKALYLADLLLPYTNDTIITEFSAKQLQWCEEHERNLWAHFLTEDLLYSSEFSKINKMVNYSPSVPGLPPEAPGRVANWTGWQIINALVTKNPGLTPADIVDIRDAQEILEMANYRPR